MALIVDAATIEGTGRTNGLVTDIGLHTVAASTYQLLGTSPHVLRLSGTTSGQIIQLPNSTSLTQGLQFWILNDANVPVTVRLFGGSLPVTLAAGKSLKAILVTPGTSSGVWDLYVMNQASSSFLGGATYVNFGYGGNANTGRFLEEVSGNSSNISPFVVVSNSTAVALSLGSSSSNSCEVGVYKNGNFTTPIISISLVNQQSNYVILTGGPFVPGDLLSVKVFSGSVNKPSFGLYLGS